MNLPNRLTLGRMIVALAVFVVLELLRQASRGSEVLSSWEVPLAWLGFVLFVAAALTDVLDGYLARRGGLTSAFGRVADPFADKILICGALVFLSSTRKVDHIIQPWVVVVVLAREFLVTGLRGYLESRGRAFGARWIGKLKMFLQSVLVGGALFCLGPGHDNERLLFLLLLIMVATVAVTAYSGWLYVKAAMRLLAAGAPGPGGPDPAGTTEARRPGGQDTAS